jgi:hypothetical protein
VRALLEVAPGACEPLTAGLVTATIDEPKLTFQGEIGNIVELMVVIPTRSGISAGRRCPGHFSYSLLAPEFSLFSANNSLLRLRREYACNRLTQ